MDHHMGELFLAEKLLQHIEYLGYYRMEKSRNGNVFFINAMFHFVSIRIIYTLEPIKTI